MAVFLQIQHFFYNNRAIISAAGKLVVPLVIAVDTPARNPHKPFASESLSSVPATVRKLIDGLGCARVERKELTRYHVTSVP